MNVYLFRHGACESPADGVDDDQRRLTPEGRSALKAAMPGMRSLVSQVNFILSSPLKRAVETASIIADEYRCTEFVELVPELAVRGNEKKITSIINRLIGKEHLVVVGHMPHLGELCQYICGDNLEEPPTIKKSGAAKIHIKQFPQHGSGMLRWVMTAEELKKAGDRSPDNRT